MADFKNVYTFDNAGRVSQITQQGQGGRPVLNKRVNYHFNAASEVTAQERHSHLTSSAPVMQTNFVRDNLGRVTQMSHSWNSIYLGAYTSTYDAAGRLTNSSRATYSNFGGVAGADASTYTHDRIGQLTGVARNPGSPASESYVYDPAGNRAVSGATTYTNVANNRIQSDGTYTYVYDEEGNITERKLTANPLQKTVFAYDHRYRLFALSEFNSAGTNVKNVVYAYDVFNRRVIKGIDPDGGAPGYGYDYTYLVYDSDDIVLGLKAGGAHSNRYLHGPAVDEVLADENTQNVLWPLRDQFYNVRDLVNHGSSHYNHIDYDAFGKVTYESNPSPAYLPHAYGFQSRERDQETGLNYHRNRYYNAAIGRWMTEDPISFDGGDYNVNRFVGNGPTNWIDPHGLIKIFGQRFVWPWDENAAGVWDTIKTYGSAAGVAAAGTASGAASGAVAGAGTGCAGGAVVGAFAGGVGAGPGCAAGASGGAIGGGIWGGLTGLWEAAHSDTAGEAATSGAKGGAISGAAGGAASGIIKARNAAQALIRPPSPTLLRHGPKMLQEMKAELRALDKDIQHFLQKSTQVQDKALSKIYYDRAIELSKKADKIEENINALSKQLGM